MIPLASQKCSATHFDPDGHSVWTTGAPFAVSHRKHIYQHALVIVMVLLLLMEKYVRQFVRWYLVLKEQEDCFHSFLLLRILLRRIRCCEMAFALELESSMVVGQLLDDYFHLIPDCRYCSNGQKSHLKSAENMIRKLMMSHKLDQSLLWIYHITMKSYLVVSSTRTTSATTRPNNNNFNNQNQQPSNNNNFNNQNT